MGTRNNSYRKMICLNYVFSILISLTFLSCFNNNSVQNSTDPISSDECLISGSPLIDSNCIKRFYYSVDSFLNPERSRINDTERRELIPCCMQLIRSGDTIAQDILYSRLIQRIEKYEQLKGGYRSIYSIATYTIGQIPCKKSLELAIRLLQTDECINTDLGEYHAGFSIIRTVIQPIIKIEKRTEYWKKIHALQKESYDKGYERCDLDGYVYRKMKPIIISDFKNNLLGL